MSIIFNGTTLDSSADITYNGTSLNKIVFNGVEVWSKAKAMPTKGQIINIDDKKYLVLKTSGNIAEVLAQYDYTTSQAFRTELDTVTFTDGSTGLKYADSDIDTLLNTTFYNSLSSSIKNAIVPKNITQDKWDMTYSQSGSVSATYAEKLLGNDGIFVLLSGDHGTVPIGDRNIYALSVTEIFEYLNVTVTDSDKIRDMFWKYKHNNIWLRSAGNHRDGVIFLFYSTKGFYSHVYSKTYAVRPAFQIDLSQVNWSVSIL